MVSNSSENLFLSTEFCYPNAKRGMPAFRRIENFRGEAGNAGLPVFCISSRLEVLFF